MRKWTRTAQKATARAPSATVDTSEFAPASLLEQSQAIAKCAAESGVAVEVDPSGDGVLWRAPEGQEDRYSQVIDECAGEVAERFGIYQGDPTPEELERWYKAFLWVRDCMITIGYPVDEPPSLGSYIDSLGSNWHPYSAAMRSSDGNIRPGVPFTEESFRELEGTCPQDLSFLLTELDL